MKLKIILILLIAVFIRKISCAENNPPVEIATPQITLSGVAFDVTIQASPDIKPDTIFEIKNKNKTLANGKINPSEKLTIKINPTNREKTYTLSMPAGYEKKFEIHTIPGWLAILPPLIAILLALIFHQVILALLAGVWVGSWIFYGGPLIGLVRTLDHYIIYSIKAGEHITLLVFLLLFGGMVGIISVMGGMQGLVKVLSRFATDSRKGQITAWFIGLLIFFDDYANTLILGNTMRPVTDKLKISREKLAYIADSIAAPIASIGLISTWIGYEVSLIDTSLKQIGSTQDAYSVFLKALPYNFYPLLALLFVVLIALTRREFGPMLNAERRAYRQGKVMADTAIPLSDFDKEIPMPSEKVPKRWINAVIPIVTVLAVTFGSLWFIGRNVLANEASNLAELSIFELGMEGIGKVFGASDSFRALLYGSASGCLVAFILALAQKITDLNQTMKAWLQGTKSMMMAVVILVLAWAISDICRDLNTSAFLVMHISDYLNVKILPALIFFLSAVTAFATGTSWATMGILIPLAVPVLHKLILTAGIEGMLSERIFLAGVSAVLAGAIFGDHCSPISDTTVMSSMASGCDHIDHVKTQLPYALTVALIAMFLGYLPLGFGVHPAICLAVCAVSLFVIIRLKGKLVITPWKKSPAG